MNKSSQLSLAPLNQTAAILLAAAVTELFPGALIAGGQGTSDRFFYDFFLPFEFQSEFLTLIEEHMRLIIREKREVRLLEMMPANASAMMRHRAQGLAADALLGVEKAVVEMCQIGGFAAYSPYPILDELAIPFFKILEGFPLSIPGKKIIRIVGAAALEKDVLKKIAKQSSASSRSHLRLAQEMGMFEPLYDGLWIWGPKGEALKEQLVQLSKELYRTQKFNRISSPAAFIGEGGEASVTQAHREYFLRTGEKKLCEIALLSSRDDPDPSVGLFSAKAFFADRAHLFCSEEKLLEECISFLQFIIKIPKILDFEFEIVLSVSSQGSNKARLRGVTLFQEALEKVGLDYTLEKAYRVGTLASIDLRIADALGRRWTGPFISVPEAMMPAGKGSVLIGSVMGSLERIAALLLEQKGGWLPLTLAPEQIRILVATGRSGPYAKQVCEGLRAQGFRAIVESSDGLLKERLYKGIEDKVPYVILLGEREEKANALTVRSYGESKEQTLSIDEFCMRLKSEMRSATSELTN